MRSFNKSLYRVFEEWAILKVSAPINYAAAIADAAVITPQLLLLKRERDRRARVKETMVINRFIGYIHKITI